MKLLKRGYLRALISITLTACLLSCSRSEFERQHLRAVSENPPDVELEIRIRDGRKQFAPSESVQFEEIYTSKQSGLWHIEVLDGWNNPSIARTVYVSDGKTMWSEPQGVVGIICCNSRHVWLSQDPVRIPYKLANPSRFNLEGWSNPEWHMLHLPKKLGKYQVYITTQRVFGRTYSTTTYFGFGFPVSSNILKLEVK